MSVSEGFGSRLKALRKERGMTQLQLASEAGVSVSAVGMYERGLREPGLETIFRLCGIFGISTDSLLGYEPEKTEIDRLLAAAEERARRGGRVTLYGADLPPKVLDRVFYGYRLAGRLALGLPSSAQGEGDKGAE